MDALEPTASPPPAPFSEKGFYLQEFRGRTLLFCATAERLAPPAPLREVVRELGANGTRSLLLCDRPEALSGLGVGGVLPADAARLEGDVWRGLRASHALGVRVPAGEAFAPGCRQVAARLGASKLVWIDPAGGLSGDQGQRLSFVHAADLDALAAGPAAPRRPLLDVVRAFLEGGVAAVNVCTLEGVADELFTYSGSGTLFTRDRYVQVRRLTLDDYDAARDLIARGVGEGYLAPRSEEELDRVLAGGFGAFVEGRHLAGIGALLLHPEARAGEIASLYTLTRFLGEGVGAHLVGHAVSRAAELGLERVFACTTQEAVGLFFERQGFAPVPDTALPASRWKGYDPARRTRVRCYARTPAASSG